MKAREGERKIIRLLSDTKKEYFSSKFDTFQIQCGQREREKNRWERKRERKMN